MKHMKRITIFGMGTIGTGWATACVMADVPVIVYDPDEKALAGADCRIRSNLDFLAELGVMTQEQSARRADMVEYISALKAAVENSDFIQESGPERLSVKLEMIDLIERYCPDTAIIASSTSGILPSDLQMRAKNPERILAGHPFHPVHLLPLVEVCGGIKTSESCIKDAVGFYRSIGKETVILKKECTAFIANRLQAVLGREAEDLVYRGYCSAEDMDKAITFGPGMRWGLLGSIILKELGSGNTGIKEGHARVGVTVGTWLEDCAKWTEPPEGLLDVLSDGIAAELSNRPASQGRDKESLIRFRDEGLVCLLKYHGKL